MIKNILIATDLSPETSNTTAYGSYLASVFKADVHLIHVMPLDASDQHKSLCANKLEKKKKILEKVKTNTGINLQARCYLVSYENVIKSIAECISICNADLLIMGLKQNKTLDEIYHGNYRSRSIQLFKVPVLFIPEGLRKKTIKNIGYANDFQKDELEIVHKVSEWACTLKSGLSVLHIEDNVNNKVLTEKSRKFLTGIKPELACAKTSFHFIQDTELTKGIRKFVKNYKVDLLVMTSHSDKNTKSSITQSIAEHTHLPLLVFHK